MGYWDPLGTRGHLQVWRSPWGWWAQGHLWGQGPQWVTEALVSFGSLWGTGALEPLGDTGAPVSMEFPMGHRDTLGTGPPVWHRNTSECGGPHGAGGHPGVGLSPGRAGSACAGSPGGYTHGAHPRQQQSQREPGETREQHIGRVLAQVAPSMSLCSLSEVICFLLGERGTWGHWGAEGHGGIGWTHGPGRAQDGHRDQGGMRGTGTWGTWQVRGAQVGYKGHGDTGDMAGAQGHGGHRDLEDTEGTGWTQGAQGHGTHGRHRDAQRWGDTGDMGGTGTREHTRGTEDIRAWETQWGHRGHGRHRVGKEIGSTGMGGTQGT